MHLIYTLLMNLLIGVLWMAFQPEPSAGAFVTGLLLGFVVLSLLQRAYWRRIAAIADFVLYLLLSIMVSSLGVIHYVLFPPKGVTRGIVAVPLEVQSRFEIATLASAITLTPGTLSLEIGESQGQRMLFVHTLNLIDPGATVREIKDGFERRILRATRGPDAI
jgi:multicomponent Na+:H+ antiporter subunit E